MNEIKSCNQLTVVVPAVNLLSDVRDCLAALEKNREDVELEVLLVNRLGQEVHQAVKAEFPWVEVIEVPSNLTIPLMRAEAFKQSSMSAVAVIEDHVIVPPGWGRQLLDALDEGADVVAGSVENAACEKLVDWAAFLCEYSHLIPPIPAGKVDSLTGNNVVYRRDLLQRHQDDTEAGEWENYLHDRLKESGVELICRPEIVVGHKKHYTFGEYMSQRYLYARSYAGKRVEGASPIKRLVFGGGACVLPPLLLYRICKRVLEKGKYRGLLVRSLPMISLFVTSWAVGEIVGSLAGAGDSLSRVR